MTPERIATLRECAIAAGGSEWWLDGTHDTVWGSDGDAICKTFSNLGNHPEPIDERQLAEFIAEACPSTVLALLDEIAATEARLHEVATHCAGVEQELAALKEVRRDWRLLPLEPTMAMGQAYLDAAHEACQEGDDYEYRFNFPGYRAMLSAAPLPTSGAGEKPS